MIMEAPEQYYGTGDSTAKTEWLFVAFPRFKQGLKSAGRFPGYPPDSTTSIIEVALGE